MKKCKRNIKLHFCFPIPYEALNIKLGCGKRWTVRGHAFLLLLSVLPSAVGNRVFYVPDWISCSDLEITCKKSLKNMLQSEDENRNVKSFELEI